MQTKNLLLIILTVVFASCSTAYRSGQTPDDVYYSPEPKYDEYVSQQNQDDRDSYSYRNSEENEIRQGIRNPRYRSSVSINLGSGYAPYAFGYAPYYSNPYDYNSYGYNSYGYKNFNRRYSYGYYDNYYNSYPYYGGYYGHSYNNYNGGNYGYSNNYYSGIGTINTNRGVRRMNGVSNNYGSNNPNIRSSNSYTPAPARTFPARRQSSGMGNVIRRVFTPANNSNSRSNDSRTFNNNRNTQNAPSRDFNNSSSQTNSSSGSSSSTPSRVFRK